MICQLRICGTLRTKGPRSWLSLRCHTWLLVIFANREQQTFSSGISQYRLEPTSTSNTSQLWQGNFSWNFHPQCVSALKMGNKQAGEQLEQSAWLDGWLGTYKGAYQHGNRCCSPTARVPEGILIKCRGNKRIIVRQGTTKGRRIGVNTGKVLEGLPNCYRLPLLVRKQRCLFGVCIDTVTSVLYHEDVILNKEFCTVSYKKN